MTGRGGRTTIKSLVLQYVEQRRIVFVDEGVLASIEAKVRGVLGGERPVSRSSRISP